MTAIQPATLNLSAIATPVTGKGAHDYTTVDYLKSCLNLDQNLKLCSGPLIMITKSI